ncbi:probable LRR receptor-like serine/threonine-protein kinase At3g47570 [Durio zibethinus]|uniref:non-specific serine/threonine protein kinase n=1 Tax=Durio zibethinus TaxID=66656 RepID=A0A6P6AHA9_DURZI|nr:probable LRR receptor-like serine/threonine-protein kinase At3g47570 [Durio zibethinus]
MGVVFCLMEFPTICVLVSFTLLHCCLLINLQIAILLGIASFGVGGNETDQQALLEFKAKISSDQLGVMHLWNNSVHFCHWPGITCMLNLQNNSFSREIPQDVGRLRRLQELKLSNNSIVGEIPSNISGCSKLRVIKLSNNQLVGEIPVVIGSLSNLKVVIFIPQQFKRLSSAIPETLDHLANLTFFSVAEYELSGLVPSSLFTLSNLKVLDIGSNRIEGTLPWDLRFTIPSLEVLAVSNNQLSGSLSASISNSSNLIQLEVVLNTFTGNLPSFDKLEKLQWFAIAGNLLGSRRADDFNFLCTLTNATGLQVLLFFPTIIPECISNLSHSPYNRNAPEATSIRCKKKFSVRKCLISLDLSNNNLSGSIPPELLAGLSSLSIALDLSSNHLTGVLPTEVGNLKVLGALDVSRNMLSGVLPSTLGSCIRLEELVLGGNFFRGSIPNSLSLLRGLVVLELSHNNLSGAAPTEGIFRNSSATFIQGNSKLCGGSPDFHLPKYKISSRSRTSLPEIITVIVSGIIGEEKKAAYSELFGKFTFTVILPKHLKAADRFSSANLVGAGSFGSTLTACSSVDYQGNDFKSLGYEFMVHGSLEDWLHASVGTNIAEEAPKKLEFSQRLNVAVDVACALDYFHHHCETLIVHCDLKPNNILFDDEMVGNVGDFGLAKFMSADMQNYSTSLSSLLRGTIGYIAPEYGLGKKVSSCSDVYSNGILLLEMFTGKRPTDDMFKEDLNLRNYVKQALPERVAEITDPILLQEIVNQSKQRVERFLQCLISIFGIGVTCSAKSPSERMNMTNVTAELCSVGDKLLPTRLPH